ncbi:hypothetical protein D3C85_1201330 [compost metagenome]
MHLANQLAHAVEHALHLGHHVDPVDPHLVADRPAQRGVQGRALFRAIDQGAVEQIADRLRQPRLVGQADQQLAAAAVDQVLRVVEKQPAVVQRERGEALGIRGEGLAQREAAQLFAVRGEGLPTGQAGDING